MLAEYPVLVKRLRRQIRRRAARPAVATLNRDQGDTMGIIRTRTILVRSTGQQTHESVVNALAAEKVEILSHSNPIRAKSARALLKNRWAAEMTIEILEDRMVWSVDALGDKHEQIIEELLAHLPPGMIDDQGVADAVARLSKASRTFGKAEIGRLGTILTPTEHVITLAVGTFEKTMGALILTTERLVFFDQTLMTQKIEEFNLDAIQSLGVEKKRTGETIGIAISGRKAEITNIHHGEGEALVAAFREVRGARSAASSAPAAFEPDAMDQLRKLGDLHQAGILTDDEFASKKAELLDRM